MVRRRRLLSTTFRSLIFSAAVLTAAACVYFNRMYNANRLFAEAQKDIEAGQTSAGQASLAAAIAKAERVVQEHPGSRWADDALRLIVQARILRGDWPEAAETSQQLLTYARSRKDSAEVAGYLGTAKLNLGEIAVADSLLSIALMAHVGDREKASLYLNRGRARVALQLEKEAEADFAAASKLRPQWVEPRLEWIRLLVALGRVEPAAAEAAGLITLPLNHSEEREVIELFEYLATASPATGIAALQDIESSDLSREDRAHLMTLRGEMKVKVGLTEEGIADLRSVTSIDVESRWAVEAEAAVVSYQLHNAQSAVDIEAPLATVMRLSRIPAARASREVAQLRDTLIRMDFWISRGSLGFLLAAETARDELQAPRLARNLFLAYVDEQPTALWAPKAILAALELSGLDSDDPSPEVLRQRLLDDYANSAYVQQLTGGTGAQFSYEELEQGLRLQLQRLERLADQEVRARTSAASN